ncbi:ABC transporter ATP-binding protein [Candidatus Pelagibacter sp.]|nr:ABC transporter ATP-binding protein [Candidatus Pelagibacter sp.]
MSPEKIIDLISNIYISEILLSLSEYERALYGFITVGSLFFIKAIAILLINYYELKISREIDLENTQKLFSKYINAPFIFHIYNNPSELIQNLNDVKRSTSVIIGLSTIFKEVLIILAISSMLIISNIKLFSYILLILIIPVVFILNFFKNILLSKGEIAIEFRNKRLKILSESISNIKFIKLMNAQNFIIDYFKKNNFKAVHQDMVATYISKIPKIILETFSIITILSVIFFLYVSKGGLVEIIPILTLLIVSIIRFIPSVGSILVSVNNYRYNLPALKVFDLSFHEEVEISNTENKIINKNNINFKDKIEVKNISYHYPNNQIDVLKNLNFEINKGEKIGISGKSGSGKTTLLNLILGLLTPIEGSIKCDGKEIRDDIKNWYYKIAYVPQKITLFEESIKKNICFGISENNIKNEDFKDAIKISELNSFINSLPEKFETNVGHDGSIVSGGQLQRIGIARALYLKPDILILDEPTSNLDSEIEMAIINSLFKIRNLTIILISHNKSILEKCDRLIKLD